MEEQRLHVFTESEAFDPARVYRVERPAPSPGFTITPTYKAVPFLLGGGTLDVVVSYSDPRDAYASGLEVLRRRELEANVIGFVIMAGWLATRTVPHVTAETIKGAVA